MYNNHYYYTFIPLMSGQIFLLYSFEIMHQEYFILSIDHQIRQRQLVAFL